MAAVSPLRAGMERLFGPLSEEVLRQIEAGGRWRTLRRGEQLFRQDDAADGLFLLASGRLRAVREEKGGERVLGDVAMAETVGEMAFFTGERRSATVYALRDSTVVHFSNDVFQQLLGLDPRMATTLARLIIDRYRRSFTAAGPARIVNIGVVAATPGLDVAAFARSLAAALAGHGPALFLDAETVDRQFGSEGAARAPFSDPRAPGLIGWLVGQEEAHRFVVYQADAEPTPWSGRVIRQADHILILADPAADPALSEIERTLLGPPSPTVSAQRTLVLLHGPGVALPDGTARWLEPRHLDDHEHLRGAGRDQFERLARILAGRAVGLVLGGGGARGFAHIGIVRALREAGVPIDRVGGTSMGGVVAAQCAMGWDHEEMLRRSRAVFVELGAHREYTLPLFSLLSGKKRARMGEMLYGNACIEDLWTEFFCISANLTRSNVRVHRRGSVAHALAASTSLPGIVVPVRDDGDLLVDGGVVNNLPADVMREIGAGVVIISDVAVETDIAMETETFPSPWSVVRGKLLRRPVPRAPTIIEILLRTTLLASSARAGQTRSAGDFYLQPPLAEFSLMDFDVLERAAQIGYEYTLQQIEAWGGRAATA
jgi:predicted acylesterase/phospholipase RssA